MDEHGVPGTGIKAKGFFANLFDTGFTSFISPTVWTTVYGLSVVLIVPTGVVFFVVSIVQGNPLFAVIAPFGTLIAVILSRMSAENAILFFRIGENLAFMADLEMADLDEDPAN